MGEKAKNIAGLFRDARSRTIIVLTGIVIVGAILIGVFSMRDKLFGSNQGVVSITNAPGGIQSVPFQAPNAEYAKLQEQQNAQQAAQAEAAGGSAIPTIIHSGKFVNLTPEQQAAISQGGIGFNELHRIEEEGNTFTPKSLNQNQNAPGDFSAFCNPCVTCANGLGINNLINNQNPLGLTTPTNLPAEVVNAPQINPMAGQPVYDSHGNLIGTVGVDGKVRDANGKVIGMVGLDGVVRDANGNVIGQSQGAAAAVPKGVPGAPAIQSGTPIYDSQGHIIGYVGPDGKVRDANGNVIGTVGPDGLVRDANGNIIGGITPPAATKQAQPAPTASALGTPIYDAQGHLIGYAGADGKVRDANGNVIGTLGPDGLVRDANGKVIGSSQAPLGKPIYDAQGHLIGYADANGNVHDLNGKLIGTLGPDGLVRDVNGNVIGKAGALTPAGTPVYDANGKLIGYAGADGKVRDLNGNVIGTIGPDGLVRDKNGNIIGRALAAPPGSPVYDANGRLIGYVGADGKVRDAAGNIIGTLGPDGLVRDDHGNVIGSVNPQLKTNDRLNTLAYQLQMGIGDPRVLQLFGQRRGQMAGQVGQLIGAWVSPVQSYVNGTGSSGSSGSSNASGGSNTKSGSSSASGGSTVTGPIFIKAGTIMFATINTAVDSDEPGPVLATIIGGDLQGGKLMGTLTNQGQAVMITFNVLTLPTFNKSISISAVAIDQNTARTALSTYTDNHYWMRYGTLFAASFVQGYGQAIQQSGTTVSTTGLTTQTATPALSPKKEIAVALGNVGAQMGNQLNSLFNTPPTVHVDSGTGVGILFLSDVPRPAA